MMASDISFTWIGRRQGQEMLHEREKPGNFLSGCPQGLQGA